MSNHQLIANRFELQNLLGRGGMGEVYRAIDTQTGEMVAVKALNPEALEQDQSMLERFTREGEALRQLNHPNIVHMIATIKEGDRLYLVMEYVGGGSLQDLLDKRGCLLAPEVVRIALEIADALTRAHHLGIIHRDIKPANVLLSEDGTPRLADFGIAHITSVSPLTQTGIAIGSIDYLSPEACRGEAPDERIDIWSFGVVLFQLLTGEKPFKGDSMVAKLNAILTQKIPDLSQLAPGTPDALIDLIYRMLEKDRLQRIPSVRLVGAELEALWKGREPVVPSHPISAEGRFATPTPATDAPKYNLPVQTAPFIGREAELLELSRLLSDPSVRLLTILGMGGVGKTRLAVEAARNEIGTFERGVYFVPLAPLQSADAIVSAMAKALDYSFYKGSEPRQQLLDYLREKRLLLVLDNFEHLLEGVGLLGEILQNAEKVKVLVTSRVKLNMQDEHLFHLEGMDFPNWETPEDALEYSAVKLFIQGARRVKPGFELVTEDLKYVARICKLVGGMPLGILMAAAWVKMLNPQEIAAEISKNIDFLSTDMIDVAERQRNIRVVFNYACGLLTRKERKAFQGLSVFRGGFTREASQQVTDVTVCELMELVDKSLIRRAPTGRYEMHELVRQYGAELLLESGETDAIYQRHLHYYLHLSEQLQSKLRGPNQRDVLDSLEQEYHNIFTALQWSIGENGNIENGMLLIAAIVEFCDLRTHYPEGSVWAEAAISKIGSTPSLIKAKGMYAAGFLGVSNNDYILASVRLEECQSLCRELGEIHTLADALSLLGFIACDMGDFGRAETMLKESLDLHRKQGYLWGIADATANLARIAEYQSDYEGAAPLYLESLALSRQMGDKIMIADSLRGLGNIALERSNYDEARTFQQERLAIASEIGSKEFIANSLTTLGRVDLYQGRYAEAQALFEKSLALLDEIGAGGITAYELCHLGLAAHHQGDYQRARALLKESLWHWAKMNSPRFVIRCLEWLSGTYTALGKPDLAVRLCATAETSRSRMGFPISKLEHPYRDRTLDTARTQLGDASFDAFWSEGQSMSVDQAVELALQQE